MTEGIGKKTALQKAFLTVMEDKIGNANIPSDVDMVIESIMEYQIKRNMALDDLDLIFLKAAGYNIEQAFDYEMTYRRITEINDTIKSYLPLS